MKQTLNNLFDNVPPYNRTGYSLSPVGDNALVGWLKSIMEVTNGDIYIQEEILDKLIFLFPVFKKGDNEHNRVFCTLALKYYQSISMPGKRIQEIMAGAYKKMLKWEAGQKEIEPLYHHYTSVLNEYLNYLTGEGKIPPYLNLEVKELTDNTKHQRLYFESPLLRRETYCDLWYPSNNSTTIMLYHITGYSGKTEQQKLRHSHPDNFTKNYLKVIEQFPEECISLCVIPCPYEDVYKAFVRQFSGLLVEVLFPAVEQSCGYQPPGRRAMSAFSKGGFYTYSLIWKLSIVNAVVTHSGAQVEIFTNKLKNGDLPIEGMPIMVTCGKEDSFYQNNKIFTDALQHNKVRYGSHFYNGTHDWQDVESVFVGGLKWLVTQVAINPSG